MYGFENMCPTANNNNSALDALSAFDLMTCRKYFAGRITNSYSTFFVCRLVVAAAEYMYLERKLRAVDTPLKLYDSSQYAPRTH